MLLNVSGLVGIGSRPISSPIFKANRVGCQHNDPLTDQCWTEGLKRISHQTTNFALAEVSLAVMLMVNQHSGKWPRPVGHQQKGGDQVAFLAGVADADPAIAMF